MPPQFRVLSQFHSASPLLCSTEMDHFLPHPSLSSSLPFKCSLTPLLFPLIVMTLLSLLLFFLTFVSSFHPFLLPSLPLSCCLSLSPHDLFSSSSQRRHLGLGTRATEGMTPLLRRKKKRRVDARAMQRRGVNEG